MNANNPTDTTTDKEKTDRASVDYVNRVPVEQNEEDMRKIIHGSFPRASEEMLDKAKAWAQELKNPHAGVLLDEIYYLNEELEYLKRNLQYVSNAAQAKTTITIAVATFEHIKQQIVELKSQLDLFSSHVATEDAPVTKIDLNYGINPNDPALPVKRIGTNDGKQERVKKLNDANNPAGELNVYRGCTNTSWYKQLPDGVYDVLVFKRKTEDKNG